MSEVDQTEIKSYRDLRVWQRSIDLTDLVYSSSRTWPREEVFGLTSQIRRAAVSVSANISEGSGRRTKGEYLNHLGIARGSLHEVTTLALIAHRQGLLETTSLQDIDRISGEVGRLLSGLIRSLDRRKE